MQTVNESQLSFGEDLKNKEIIERAIQRARTNADPEWKELAMELIIKVAQRKATLTADDIWEAGLPETRENRALGAVMQDAAKKNILRSTNTVQKSRRVKHNHGRSIAIWRSMIWNGIRF